MKYTTFNGTIFTLKIVENIRIFNLISQQGFKEPKPPKYKIKDTPEGPLYGENIMHPKYQEALNLYQTRLALFCQNAALLLCIERNEDIIKGLRNNPAYRLTNPTNDEIWLKYIFQNTDENDLSKIINQCFLTENIVYNIFNVLAKGVYRNRRIITEARLVNGLNSTISIDSILVGKTQLVHPVDEYNCAVSSGFSIKEWREMPVNDRAETLALYRLAKIIENHSQDEAQEQAKKKK